MKLTADRTFVLTGKNIIRTGASLKTTDEIGNQLIKMKLAHKDSEKTYSTKIIAPKKKIIEPEILTVDETEDDAKIITSEMFKTKTRKGRKKKIDVIEK